MNLTKGLSIGDVFISKFLDNEGNKVRQHPMIVVYQYGLNGFDNKWINIIGAFALSDSFSTKSLISNTALPDVANLHIPKNVGLEKDSQVQIDSLLLFAVSENSPIINKKTKLGYWEWVEEIKERFNELINIGHAKINGLNLPNHPYVDNAVKEMLYNYWKIWPEAPLWSSVYLKQIKSTKKVNVGKTITKILIVID